MKIVSVNVGLSREIVWKGITVQTAIFKEPVAGMVAIRKLNLTGDQQADLTVHGGTAKAVYAYPVDHYEYWRRQLQDVPLSWGAFGENLATEGPREETLCVGDLLRVGSAVLQVTQPRMPCYKLELRLRHLLEYAVRRREPRLLTPFSVSSPLPDPTRARDTVAFDVRGTGQLLQSVRWTLCPFERLNPTPPDLLVRQQSSHRSFGLLGTWLHNSGNRVAKVVGIYFELCDRGQCQPQTRGRDD